MSGLVLALLFLLPPPQPQTPAFNSRELINKVSDYYGRLKSLSAEFEQIQKDANREHRMRGLVYLKSGRRALFEYQSPFKRFDYFDGKKHTRYEPGDDYAIARSMGRLDDERLLIFLVLGNPGSPWKDEFGEKRELSNPKNPGNKVVQLIPNNRKNILDVTVEVDPATLLIHRFAFTRVDKSYTEYIFTNIKTTPLDDSRFKFQAPPGVKVLER